MARSRVSHVVFALDSFRPRTVWISLNLRRGSISPLRTRTVCNFVIRKPLASSLSVSYSHTMLPFVQSRTQSTLPWSDVHPYNAVRIRLEGEWQDKDDFRECLRAHVKQWQSEGKSAVWLHIPLSLGSLVPVAHSEGFALHHAKEGEVILSIWLDTSRESKIPSFASHQVGACGVVFREDTMEVLVTQDKHKISKWKFPGGIADFGEDIADTAEREVREETGIISEFQSVLGFRQQHMLKSAFNQSDLFFVCRMKPLSYDITPCQDEVLKCQWIGLKELQLTPDATQFTNRIATLLAEGVRDSFESLDIKMEEWPSIFAGQTYKIFYRKTMTDKVEPD